MPATIASVLAKGKCNKDTPNKSIGCQGWIRSDESDPNPKNRKEEKPIAGGRKWPKVVFLIGLAQLSCSNSWVASPHCRDPF